MNLKVFFRAITAVIACKNLSGYYLPLAASLAVAGDKRVALCLLCLACLLPCTVDSGRICVYNAGCCGRLSMNCSCVLFTLRGNGGLSFVDQFSLTGELSIDVKVKLT
ncbi:hypothetical protein T4D_16826 [Trichinella pseudospiralis]|uniref:Uncharacterized protein n=1 Tax=Trichinella pseudospiralis TaxID=6337 RepID=A0A0V1FWF4_TRIPS|nr:hypothetical protein T4D_16826 [Trichinella pseudospiralis]